MAHNSTPLTGIECTFKEGEFIISKTDQKGIITYCNEVCLRVAGYKEEEILEQQHNILRHPDMPRCVFKFLWDTISSGEEVIAYVINKCKNGDHYWVFAQVTPTYDDDENIIGYYSSRRVVRKEALETIKGLYKTLLDEEAKHASQKEGMEASLNILLQILKDGNVSYTEFIMKLQHG